MPSKLLNPNAEPYYLQHQKLTFPTPAVAIGFSQHGRHFHPYAPYGGPCGTGFVLCPPNHFVNQEALVKNAKEGGIMQRRGAVQKSKRCHEKKKVKEAKEKKLPENGGVAARRAVIPFPTTVEEAEVSRTTTVMIRYVPNQFK